MCRDLVSRSGSSPRAQQYLGKNLPGTQIFFAATRRFFAATRRFCLFFCFSLRESRYAAGLFPSRDLPEPGRNRSFFQPGGSGSQNLNPGQDNTRRTDDTGGHSTRKSSHAPQNHHCQSSAREPQPHPPHSHLCGICVCCVAGVCAIVYVASPVLSLPVARCLGGHTSCEQGVPPRVKTDFCEHLKRSLATGVRSHRHDHSAAGNTL